MLPFGLAVRASDLQPAERDRTPAVHELRRVCLNAGSNHIESNAEEIRKDSFRVFLRGLVIILPFTLTVALVVWLATAAEDLLGGVIQRLWPGQYWPGLGILLGLLIVFAAGLLMHDPITRWLLVLVVANYVDRGLSEYQRHPASYNTLDAIFCG